MHAQPAAEQLLRDVAPQVQAPNKYFSCALDGVPVRKPSFSRRSAQLEFIVGEPKRLATLTALSARHKLPGCVSVVMNVTAWVNRCLAVRKVSSSRDIILLKWGRFSGEGR
jgi:tetrahydromethanopterin S-methyltransferase subunit E